MHSPFGNVMQGIVWTGVLFHEVQVILPRRGKGQHPWRSNTSGVLWPEWGAKVLYVQAVSPSTLPLWFCPDFFFSFGLYFVLQICKNNVLDSAPNRISGKILLAKMSTTKILCSLQTFQQQTMEITSAHAISLSQKRNCCFLWASVKVITAVFVTGFEFVTSLPLKTAQRSIGADRGSGLTGPLVYPPPLDDATPTDHQPSKGQSQPSPRDCHPHWCTTPPRSAWRWRQRYLAFRAKSLVASSVAWGQYTAESPRLQKFVVFSTHNSVSREAFRSAVSNTEHWATKRYIHPVSALESASLSETPPRHFHPRKPYDFTPDHQLFNCAQYVDLASNKHASSA